MGLGISITVGERRHEVVDRGEVQGGLASTPPGERLVGDAAVNEFVPLAVEMVDDGWLRDRHLAPPARWQAGPSEGASLRPHSSRPTAVMTLGFPHMAPAHSEISTRRAHSSAEKGRLRPARAATASLARLKLDAVATDEVHQVLQTILTESAQGRAADERWPAAACRSGAPQWRIRTHMTAWAYVGVPCRRRCARCCSRSGRRRRPVPSVGEAMPLLTVATRRHDLFGRRARARRFSAARRDGVVVRSVRSGQQERRGGRGRLR